MFHSLSYDIVRIYSLLRSVYLVVVAFLPGITHIANDSNQVANEFHREPILYQASCPFLPQAFAMCPLHTSKLLSKAKKL